MAGSELSTRGRPLPRACSLRTERAPTERRDVSRLWSIPAVIGAMSAAITRLKKEPLGQPYVERHSLPDSRPARKGGASPVCDRPPQQGPTKPAIFGWPYNSGRRRVRVSVPVISVPMSSIHAAKSSVSTRLMPQSSVMVTISKSAIFWLSFSDGGGRVFCPFRRWASLPVLISERPMPFGKQSGEGAALPVAPAETVKGSGRRGGAARSPATGEDTARLDDDAHRAALAP